MLQPRPILLELLQLTPLVAWLQKSDTCVSVVHLGQCCSSLWPRLQSNVTSAAC